jgi:glycosyltransferase involved in cell wall biosynthesis
MNKVYVLAPGEDWIVDRFVNEFNEDNSDIVVESPEQADVIWAYADWCWQKIPHHLLRSKKIIMTVHHVVPEKFGESQHREFLARDTFTDSYFVPNFRTRDFISSLTIKPINITPYWANQKIWRATDEKNALRHKYKIPKDSFVIGSFQRDTEGAGITQGIFLPKLEKGPDLLADYIEMLHTTHPTLHVLIAGWRRQYLISRLQKAHVPYTYIELPSQEVINELYQTLDLYPVTARYEGGPQSLIECGLLNVPCISRPIGIADVVLPRSAINDDVSCAIPAIPSVDKLKLPLGYDVYRRLIQSQ